MNQQPIERVVKVSDTLEVVDIWDTFQGEGPFAGMPATFIRLAGCVLDCPLCDTDYTSNRNHISVEGILDRLQQLPERKLVVLTGGEPLRQPIAPLMESLLDQGHQVQIETNGTLYREEIPFRKITIVCSPKTPIIHSGLIPWIHTYKYVVEAGKIDPKDGLPLSVLGLSHRPGRPSRDIPLTRISVQPADQGDEQKNRENLRAAMASCQQFGYRLCLQMHKIIGVP